MKIMKRLNQTPKHSPQRQARHLDTDLLALELDWLRQAQSLLLYVREAADLEAIPFLLELLSGLDAKITLLHILPPGSASKDHRPFQVARMAAMDLSPELHHRLRRLTVNEAFEPEILLIRGETLEILQEQQALHGLTIICQPSDPVDPMEIRGVDDSVLASHLSGHVMVLDAAVPDLIVFWDCGRPSLHWIDNRDPSRKASELDPEHIEGIGHRSTAPAGNSLVHLGRRIAAARGDL